VGALLLLHTNRVWGWAEALLQWYIVLCNGSPRDFGAGVLVCDVSLCTLGHALRHAFMGVDSVCCSWPFTIEVLPCACDVTRAQFCYSPSSGR